MKTLITLIFVIFIGFTAQAANGTKKVAVEVNNIEIAVPAQKEEKVVRVYKYKNSRVKKALSFTTKRNKAKLA